MLGIHRLSTMLLTITHLMRIPSLTLGLEDTSTASDPLLNKSGKEDSRRSCSIVAACENAKPPPINRTLEYNFFFISEEAKWILYIKNTVEKINPSRHYPFLYYQTLIYM